MWKYYWEHILEEVEERENILPKEKSILRFWLSSIKVAQHLKHWWTNIIKQICPKKMKRVNSLPKVKSMLVLTWTNSLSPQKLNWDWTFATESAINAEVSSGFWCCYAPGLTTMVSPGYSPEAQWSPFCWPRSPATKRHSHFGSNMVKRNGLICLNMVK